MSVDSRLVAAAVGGVVLGAGVAWAMGRSSPKPAASTTASSPADTSLVKNLEAENSRLQAELDSLSTSLLTSSGAAPAFLPPVLTRQSSTLSDGSSVTLSTAELHTLRRIFDLFDADNSGTITANELQALHVKLGEPLTDDEAAAAIAAMGSSSSATQVTFEEFVKFWDGSRRGDASRASERYSARFKFVKAKVANPDVGKIYTETSGGVFPSLDYRVRFFFNAGAAGKVEISPWHDVALQNPDGTFNFICEIPKWSRAKMEIATGEVFNPIKQDTKNGLLRDYNWGDMMFNYGAFPQTWEDPAHVTEDTGAKGDNDPLDVIEIGNKQWSTGSIVRVKVLGVLALIDSGETDWKVITISAEDPLAASIDDIDDVEAHLPGAISALHYWLKMYKSASGVINEFGFDGKCQGKEYAEGVVHETHTFWKSLVSSRGAAATV